jgi:nitronate monooxygenase
VSDIEAMPYDFGVSMPVFAAPMGGGPGTPALVIEAARAGGLGFLAGGYKTPEAVAAEIDQVTAAGVPFGVNLFAPNPFPVDRAEYRRYAELMSAEADRYGVSIPEKPIEDDDGWRDKIDVLLAKSAPFISFTFGIPSPDDLRRLRATGAMLLQTVTSPDEASAAASAGLDGLVVQSADAGGHSGTLTPRQPVPKASLPELVAAVRDTSSLPIIAAGGVATPEDVAATLRAGADAVAVGTVLLRSDEAGTSATHRAALADPYRPGTVVTHAFTGRPARGLHNTFIEAYEPIAPYGYPALHYLTTGIRKAAAAAGDPERVHLWAGTGYRHATEEPAAKILVQLAGGARNSRP